MKHQITIPRADIQNVFKMKSHITRAMDGFVNKHDKKPSSVKLISGSQDNFSSPTVDVVCSL